jgi:hypothetical protein
MPRVWCPIALCVVFSGCGFQSRPGAVGGDGPPPPPPPDDAELPDEAAIDAANDADTTSDCFARWFGGMVSLETPVKLTRVSADDSDERDPWVSRDGLRLYFAKDTKGPAQIDIYLATRNDTSKDFDNATPVMGVNSSDRESRGSLTLDEKLLALSRSVGGGKFDIYLTARNQDNLFESPSKDHLDNINKDGIDHYDPFLAAGGKRLYLAPAPNPPAHQHIVVATRGANTEDFATPVDVKGIADGVSSDADPAVTEDDRILVFSSTRFLGGTNLWYATRADPQKGFDAPKLIPDVNSAFNDGDPVLSLDGCELYFSSKRDREHVDYDLYVAKVSTRASPLPVQR